MDHPATVNGVGVSVGDEGLGAPVVIVEARGEYLPIFISPDQAQSMQFALHGEPSERPLTHDLLIEMITDFGGAFDGVRIDDLADGTYYAKIDTELYHGGEIQRFVFDARPSDGIAIALRVDCPISVADHVLDEAGQSPEEFDVREFGQGGIGPDEPDW